MSNRRREPSLAFVANALIGGRVTVYTRSDAQLTGVLESVDERMQLRAFVFAVHVVLNSRFLKKQCLLAARHCRSNYRKFLENLLLCAVVRFFVAHN